MRPLIVFAYLGALWLANAQKPVMTPPEQVIADRLNLRTLPDDERARVTKELALAIRALPSSPNKLMLASRLSNLATEGDFGRDTLQEVTTTLNGSLQGQSTPVPHGDVAMPYLQLARLVKYENMQGAMDTPQFKAAMAQLDAEDRVREKAEFTLPDLDGKQWSLKELRGKVVLVNFWATWCPPCRKEMPDLEELYTNLKDRGFVVLAITDEDIGKAKRFVDEKKYTFPVLLDRGRQVAEACRVDGIPKSLVYDRQGKLVAQSIDMRTKQQFTEMLARAGLKY